MNNNYVYVFSFLPKSFIEYIISWWEAELGRKVDGSWRLVPCHTGIAYNGLYYDISDKGFRKATIETALKNSKKYFVSLIPKRLIQIKKLDELMITKARAEYDYRGLFHFVFPFIKQKKKAYYCSELVADLLKQTFIPKLYKRFIDFKYPSPYDIFKVLGLAFKTVREEEFNEFIRSSG